MRILEFPETRQVFNFDCGANALVSVLVFAGLEEREDRVAMLARTTHNGTSTTGILRVMQYYGLLCGGPHNKPSVAHSVMWPSSFLRRYFSVSPTLCAT
jgi:predicted double-glycine peptidase